MDTFTWIPSTGTRGSMKPRKLRAQFGEGYSQHAKDGINARLRVWDLVFDPIHATVGLGASGANLNDIDDFLADKDGCEKFLWTQPTPFNTEGPQQFICEQWEFVYNEGGALVGLHATFEQQPT
jgi:phage-related protein